MVAEALSPPVDPARRRRVVAAALGAGLLAATALVGLASIMLGEPRLGVAEALDVLLARSDDTRDIVVHGLRLPRFVVAIACGGALGIAGLLLQDALRNPIAGPELLGVTTGAAAAVVAVIVFDLGIGIELRPLLGLAGGLAGGAAVLVAARTVRDPVRLTLIGAIMTSFLTSLVIVEMSLGRQQEVGQVLTYLVGSLRGVGWTEVWIVAPAAAAGVILAVLAARIVNIMRLDQEVAQGLGVHVGRWRLGVMVLSAMLVAAVVAVAGPISYVSLLAPHLARRAAGTGDVRIAGPLAALMGAALLPAADLVARQLFYPYEVPVGIWLTLLGAPVLLLLLRRGLGRAA